MMSFAKIPARAAGESSSGAITFRWPSSIDKFTPMPPAVSRAFTGRSEKLFGPTSGFLLFVLSVNARMPSRTPARYSFETSGAPTFTGAKSIIVWNSSSFPYSYLSAMIKVSWLAQPIESIWAWRITWAASRSRISISVRATSWPRMTAVKKRWVGEKAGADPSRLTTRSPETRSRTS